jgi:hypothetical protein
LRFAEEAVVAAAAAALAVLVALVAPFADILFFEKKVCV